MAALEAFGQPLTLSEHVAVPGPATNHTIFLIAETSPERAGM
jgi:hypothetical protein